MEPRGGEVATSSLLYSPQAAAARPRAHRGATCEMSSPFARGITPFVWAIGASAPGPLATTSAFGLQQAHTRLFAHSSLPQPIVTLRVSFVWLGGVGGLTVRLRWRYMWWPMRGAGGGAAVETERGSRGPISPLASCKCKIATCALRLHLLRLLGAWGPLAPLRALHNLVAWPPALLTARHIQGPRGRPVGAQPAAQAPCESARASHIDDEYNWQK